MYYSSHCPLDASLDAPDLGSCYDDYPTNGTGFYDTYLRLSRFEVLDGTVTGDPSAEQVLLNIRLYNKSHRGDSLVFRRDGYSAMREIEPRPIPDAGPASGGALDGGVGDGGEPEPRRSSAGGCSVQSGRGPIEASVFLSALALVFLRRRRRDVC